MLYPCTTKCSEIVDMNETQSTQKAGTTKSPFRTGSVQRKVTWFNPPFSQNVTIKVGQKFPKVIDKHFPVVSKLQKVFNWNMVKVSYSCMPSMGSICKCHNPEQCPLNRHCLTNKIVYKAPVETNGTCAPKISVGLTETSLKQRYMNHLMSLRHEQYRNRTKLSKYIWSLKHEGKIFCLSWDILRKAPAYSNLSKKCDLCLTKKLMIRQVYTVERTLGNNI